MKKRLIALILAGVMLTAPTLSVYADDNTASGSEESAPTQGDTETTPEAPAEDVTEKPVEEITEAPAGSEAEKPAENVTEKPAENVTEKAPEATTKSSSSSSSSRDDDVTSDRDIEIDIDEEKNLYNYVNKDISSNSYEWRSSNTSIVTVTSRGVITGQKRGTTTVRATASEKGKNYEYTFNVSVSGSSSSSSDSRKISIDVDGTKNLYSYVDDDYEARDYDWKSNDSCVSVSAKGVITGEREGTARVTATLDDEDLKYTFNVTVGEGGSSSSSNVKEKTDWEFYLGTSDEVDVSEILEDDPDDYDWDVHDDDVAEVDERKGIISAVDEGDTKVEAEGDTDYTFDINVDRDYTFEEMSLSGSSSKSIERYLDNDVDEYDFSSNRKDVLTVNRDGEVTGVANGIAAVLCEHEDGEIVQILVTVTGVSRTTTTTTTEKAVEATTADPSIFNTKSSAFGQSVNTVTFNDISHRPWATEAVNNMASHGIIVGTGQNKFSPDANTKRCDFAIVLTKILGIDGEVASSNYTDVPFGKYYSNYVGIVKARNIGSGVKNDKFKPDEYITREDIMVMTYKGLVSIGKTFNTDTSCLDAYTDSIDISAGNEEAVAALINGGYVTGTSATTLEPEAKITRAQMAVLMNNVFNKI